MNDYIINQLEEKKVDVKGAMERLNVSTEYYDTFFKMLVNGSDIILLEEAINKEDYQIAEMSAHSLKGACLNLGVLSLADLCSDMVYAYRNNDPNIANELLPEVKKLFHEIKDIVDSE